jgi:CheY-like chemotaxis protein
MSALLDDLLELHGADRAHGEAAVVSRTTEASAPAASRRILVADDNKDAADTLALLLELYGHEVRVAHGGHAALALAQSFRPHIALLDIAMPDLDGHEVARKLRQDASCPDLVLIALTAYGQDEDKERAHEAGFHQHLTKPVDPGKLAVLIAGY